MLYSHIGKGGEREGGGGVGVGRVHASGLHRITNQINQLVYMYIIDVGFVDIIFMSEK